MSETKHGRRRILLLEFVTHERWVFDSRHFPFVQGLAESLGDDVLWLCFGATLAIRKKSTADVEMFMRLAPPDAAVLERHLEEFRPTHVMISHNVAPELLDILRRLQGRANLLSTTDHECPPEISSIHSWLPSTETVPAVPLTNAEKRLARASDRNWSKTRTDWLLRWLGLTPDSCPLFGRYLVGTISPSYRAVMANAQAERFRPHLLVLGGTTCDHRRPVSENPHYADLDLADCPQDFGCAFCTWYRGPMSDLDLDPIAVAEEQLRRVLETTGGKGRCCGNFDILDVRVFHRIDRFLEQVAALGLPPSTFYFEPRIDTATRDLERLERAVVKAAESGHSVYIYRMGAENLVDAENARFNKCLSLEQIDAGMEKLANLATAYPKNFDFDRTLGYITCTPWTTLDMLQQTVERAIERGLDPKGIWLYTPLQLYRGSPITKLAVHEGLVADRHPDISLLYEPAVNNVSTAGFLPWRFRDEKVGAAFALMVRCAAAALREVYPDDVFAGDALYQQLLATAQHRNFFARPDLFAREAIAVVREAAEPLHLPSLLAEALERYRRQLDALAPPASESPPAPDVSQPIPERPEKDRRVERIQALISSLRAKKHNVLRGMRVEILPVPDDPHMMEFRVRLGGRPYDLYLTDKAPSRPYFFQTPHYKVTFGEQTPPRSESDVRRLQEFFALLDAAASSRARRRLKR